jgi:hypothetical protein
MMVRIPFSRINSETTSMKKWSLLLFIGLLFSCGMPMGNRVDATNLQVYYLDGVEKESAIRFARYWRDMGFIGEQQQVIQLDRDEDGLLLVKLIEREIYHDELLNIQELSLIQQLQRDLAQEVFDEPVFIVITDNTFRPIER